MSTGNEQRTGDRGEERQGDQHEHEITIYVNNQPFKTTSKSLTGLEIKRLAGVPADYELFEIQGEQTIPVGNEQEVRIRENLHFRAIPSGTFGTRWHFFRD